MKRAIFTLFGTLLVNMLAAQTPDKITDIDRNEYPTVIIGEQKWMAENLRTTRFNDGTPIPIVTGPMEWTNLRTPGYSWYNNEPANKNTYGGLYNWYAVNTGKLCPEGWHVPTDGEWMELADYLGGKSIAGGKLKATRVVPDDHPGWNSPNEGATNETGFSALPGGHRVFGAGGAASESIFHTNGTFGYWWSSIESSRAVAWYWIMHSNNSFISRSTTVKAEGLSVRCMKD